jgi:signal transduction histidine kinase/DNA-binding response OmpR family regulator/CHASE3 domain sensor protein
MNLERLVIKPTAHIAFGAAGAVILALGWLAYSASLRGTESSRWVSHTLEVIQAIKEGDEQLARADAAQRGYLLTGEDIYLKERDQALSNEMAAADAIKKLTTDNKFQQADVFQLESLMATRASIMHESERLLQTAGAESAQVREAGRAATQRILDLTAVMEQQELRLLGIRRLEEQQRQQSTLVVLLAAVLMSLTVLILGYLGFVAQSRARNRAERKLSDMAESLPGAAYQAQTDTNGSAGRFEFVSTSVEHLLGIKRESLLQDLGQFWTCVLEEDKPAFVAAVENSTRTGTPLQHDFRIKQTHGEIKWIRTCASVRKEPDGSFLWSGYWSDVSNQKGLERALHDAKEAAEAGNRAKSIFLATMSHEIRTPMNGVLGMLELLSLTTLDPEQRTTLEVVRESGKSLQRIIDDILDFSKIEAGKLEVRPIVASIASTVKAVSNIFSGNASSKCLDLKCSIDPRISPAVLVDPMRLRQILNNFVSNALKFTAKGRIEIKAELIGRADGSDRVRFSVIDTGIGISPEDQARLFQPFVQAAGETTPRFGGTGLGLTICQRLAKMMGGSIQMASQVGTGTTMILDLSLPIADPKDLLAEDPVNSPDLLRITKVRRIAPDIARAQSEGTLALLADDHPTNRSLIVRQINMLGYAAESAENGIVALEKWKSGRFGILITDCNMPEMNGYELTRRIRELEAASGNKRIPIIACTANALGGEAEICFAAGMDDYLAKPVELHELAKKLDLWLPIVRPQVPLDRSVLESLTGGDVAAEREILRDFRRVNEGDAAMLQRAVDGSNIPEVITASHRIKGASKMIGATALAAVCEQIERASRADDLQAVRSNIGVFQEELQRLNHYCDADPWALAS